MRAQARRLMSTLATTEAGSLGHRLSVAVVGGGLAGSACAWRLAQQGHAVHVFDQGRYTPGGRSSTRRFPDRPGMQFDHGAQFFTLHHPEVQALTKELQRAGRISTWEPRLVELNTSSGTIVAKGKLSGNSNNSAPVGFFGALSTDSPLWVSQPSMDSICSYLITGPATTLSLGTQVSGAAFDTAARRWQLAGSKGQQLGEFDALVLADVMCGRQGSPGYVTAQGPDAMAAFSSFYTAAAQASHSRTPLFALMLAYERGASTRFSSSHTGMQLPFDAASFTGSNHLLWLARDSSKPGRPDEGWDCWVALTTEQFAIKLLGAEPGSAALPRQDAAYLSQRASAIFEALKSDLQRTGVALPEPSFMQAHRWGSAYVTAPLGVPCMTHPNVPFAAAGDFCIGAGVENALFSGLAAADAVDSMKPSNAAASANSSH